MSDLFDIRVEIDKTIQKLTVIIKNKERSEDVEGVIAAVQEYADRKEPMVKAYFGDSLVALPQAQITRVFTDKRKVCVQTMERSYELKKPLKEIEDQLSGDRFVRISQSEIINIQKVKSFDFSIAGTIGVLLDNGESTFVARRRVREVKQALSKNTHLYPTKEE
jgi:DNA-binding LytR/AlgR family response regulator